MNEDELSRIVAFVALQWPAFKPTEEQTAAWEPIIGDLSYAGTKAAVISLAAEGRDFAPNAGLLRQRTLELTTEGVPEIDRAWAEVLEQVAMTGYYRIPTFSHPAIAAAVDAMGWRNICISEDQMADRAHFLKLYAVTFARHQREALMPAEARKLLEEAAKAIGHPGELEP